MKKRNELPRGTRAVPGIIGIRVDRLGNVWSDRKGAQWKQLRGRDDGHNLLIRCRHSDGRMHTTTVGKLVLLAWRGPSPHGKKCGHRNGDYRDCRLTNLQWGLLTKPAGWASMRKYTAEQITELRRRRKNGESCAALAEAFGASPNYVSDICRGLARIKGF